MMACHVLVFYATIHSTLCTRYWSECIDLRGVCLRQGGLQHLHPVRMCKSRYAPWVIINIPSCIKVVSSDRVGLFASDAVSDRKVLLQIRPRV